MIGDVIVKERGVQTKFAGEVSLVSQLKTLGDLGFKRHEVRCSVVVASGPVPLGIPEIGVCVVICIVGERKRGQNVGPCRRSFRRNRWPKELVNVPIKRASCLLVAHTGSHRIVLINPVLQLCKEGDILVRVVQGV